MYIIRAAALFVTVPPRLHNDISDRWAFAIQKGILSPFWLTRQRNDAMVLGVFEETVLTPNLQQQMPTDSACHSDENCPRAGETFAECWARQDAEIEAVLARQMALLETNDASD